MPAAPSDSFAEKIPLRPWLLLLPNLLWLGAGVFFAVQLATFGIATPGEAAWLALLDWGPWLLLSPLVLWLALRFPFVSGRAGRSLLVHLCAISAILLLMIALGTFVLEPLHDRIRIVRVDEGAEPRLLEGPPPPGLDLMRVRFVLPIYLGLLMGAHLYVLHHAARERERRALIAEAGLAEARLSALQTQLQPHFLFNTLNAVTSLVADQPREAEAMLCALADLLRGVLEVSERREVTLAEELGFIDRYLAIQQIRFSDRLRVEREISPDVLTARVPPLLLQPLVENAIVHAVAARANPGRVVLGARRIGARLVLSVRDDGPGPRAATPSPGTGTGLKNVCARLAATHGDKARLKLAPAHGGGALVTVNLPYLPTSAALPADAPAPAAA